MIAPVDKSWPISTATSPPCSPKAICMAVSASYCGSASSVAMWLARLVARLSPSLPQEANTGDRSADSRQCQTVAAQMDEVGAVMKPASQLYWTVFGGKAPLFLLFIMSAFAILDDGSGASQTSGWVEPGRTWMEHQYGNHGARIHRVRPAATANTSTSHLRCPETLRPVRLAAWLGWCRCPPVCRCRRVR